ncbi:hypothetical protein ACPCIU_17380 [Streptomyces seoulensis]|uniref:hypothetical protein n=1 Tax=Streptomyces seoulensis TaxID=73044 RepID=UPI003C2E03E9
MRQLKQALERLAWTSDEQLEFVSRHRVGPDELALLFDDAFRPVMGVVSDGGLPQSIAEALVPVDQILAEMTEAGLDEWTQEALSTSRRWAMLRSAARESIEGLDKVEP